MSVENLTSAAITGQDSISSLVQVKLRGNSVLAGLFSDVSSFANAGDKTISFPRRTNSFTVQKLRGSQKGDDQESIFALDELALDQEAHIQWAIKKFDQARAKVEILRESIDEATVSHALGLDSDIYDALDASIYADNQLSGALTQDKIVDILTQASIIKMPKMNRAWIFSNNEYGNLLKIDGFVDASKSGMEIVRTGQIGTLYGVPVFESDTLAAAKCYLVQKQALFYGFGANPSLEDQKAIEYGTGSRRWVLDQLYGIKAVNEGKLAIRLE